MLKHTLRAEDTALTACHCLSSPSSRPLLPHSFFCWLHGSLTSPSAPLSPQLLCFTRKVLPHSHPLPPPLMCATLAPSHPSFRSLPTHHLFGELFWSYSIPYACGSQTVVSRAAAATALNNLFTIQTPQPHNQASIESETLGEGLSSLSKFKV